MDWPFAQRDAVHHKLHRGVCFNIDPVDMVDLKIDSVPVIADFKKQPALIGIVNRTAGRAVFRLYKRPDIAAFKVIPEESAFQNGTEKREHLNGPVERRLQGFRLNGLIQLTGKPKHLCVALVACGRKYFRGVVQAVLGSCFPAHGSDPSLKKSLIIR